MASVRHRQSEVFPVITGLGLASALGIGVEDHIRSIRQGNRTLRPLKELWGDDEPWSSCLAGHISDRKLLCSRRYGPASQLAVLLAEQAVADAGWDHEKCHDAAIVIGSSRGNASGWLSPWPGRRPMSVLAVPNSLHSELASSVSIELGIHGPYHVLASGCAAGLDAVGFASMLIKQGIVPRALAIGLDLPLCRELLHTYHQSGMLSENGINDPYGDKADGMCISEGGAALALEMPDTQGFSILDYRANSDAYSPLGMPPDGKYMAALLEQILNESPNDLPITLCPHASGTKGNAISEQQAIRQAFAHTALPDFRTIKPWTGHAIGGSGILELAILLAFARRGSLPPNPFWATLPCETKQNIQELPLHEPRLLIKSAASMGGHNVALSILLSSTQYSDYSS